MTKRTKALNIRTAVRKKVLERDDGACVLCGKPYDLQCAHYIGRGQSGLGVEENLVTLCTDCHRAYDQGQERADLRARIGDYLRSFYPDWDESGLVYEKWAALRGDDDEKEKGKAQRHDLCRHAGAKAHDARGGTAGGE